jgi:hypothetical protein
VKRQLIAAIGISIAAVIPNAAPANAQTHYCVDDDHICLPGNPEHKPAACYDDGGVIVALWPCHIVQLDNKGHWDVQADPGSPQYDEGNTYDIAPWDQPDNGVGQRG